LWQAGRAARDLGHLDDAARWLDEAVTTARAGRVSNRLKANCLSGRANLHIATGRSELALPLFEEALAVLGDERRSREGAIKLYRYGVALADLGRLDDAERILTEGLELTGEIGDDSGIAYMELVYADVDIRRGRLASATERLHRSLQAGEALHGTYLCADALRSLGDVAAVQGRHVDAAATLERSLGLWREIGMPLEIARTLARLERVSGDRDTAAGYGRERRAIQTDLGLDDAGLRLPPYCTIRTSETERQDR